MGVVLHYSIFFTLYMHSLRICFGCLDGNCRVLAFPSYFLIADKCLEGHTILIVQHVPDMGLCELLCYNEQNCSACDNPRCHNNGTCQSGFTEKKYRCLCPSGFTGEHCEN
ncbi:unnamed protein product, partial [Porites lobata]